MAKLPGFLRVYFLDDDKIRNCRESMCFCVSKNVKKINKGLVSKRNHAGLVCFLFCFVLLLFCFSFLFCFFFFFFLFFFFSLHFQNVQVLLSHMFPEI